MNKKLQEWEEIETLLLKTPEPRVYTKQLLKQFSGSVLIDVCICLLSAGIYMKSPDTRVHGALYLAPRVWTLRFKGRKRLLFMFGFLDELYRCPFVGVCFAEASKSQREKMSALAAAAGATSVDDLVYRTFPKKKILTTQGITGFLIGNYVGNKVLSFPQTAEKVGL